MTSSQIEQHRLARALRKVDLLEALIENRTRELYEAHRTLRASESRFRGLFESSGDAMMTLEPPTWKFTSANPATLAMFGAGCVEEFVSLEPWRVSPERQPDGQPSDGGAREMIDVAMQVGFHFFEWTHRRTTGEEFAATVLLTRVELDGKRFLQATVRDITEDKRKEAWGQMGREILQELNGPGVLQESIGRVVAILRRRTGFEAVGVRLLDGEDFPYFAQCGFSREFLRTENTLLACSATGGMCRDADGRARLECTCGMVIRGKVDPAHPFLTPGGSFWTNDSFPLLDLPADQDPRFHPRNRCMKLGYASMALVPIRSTDGIVGLIHVNDRRKGCFTLQAIEALEGLASHVGAALVRRRAEEALQFSERKFRTLFEHLAEGVVLHELVLDEDGKAADYRILDVNPAFRVHTGIDGAGASGRLGSEVYGVLPPPYLQEYGKVALGGAPCVFESFFQPLGRHFSISVVSPGSCLFATVFEDITDRKLREEELHRKNEEMERFSYMISHDLKAPLVTIGTFLGYLEQDLEQGKAERVAKDMVFIRNATVMMRRRLEDLLQFSRVGQVVSIPVKMTLADLAQEALTAVAGAIATRGVAVHVVPSSVVLFGDRQWLEEIWQNLVDNAVKYMGDQSCPRIELGCRESGAETEFYVQDNGIGIEPRFHGKVFGLFEKLFGAGEGTGLGLALVKRIVETYGGRIWLESEGLGQGTCFRFTLPLALKDDRPAAA